MKRYSLIFATSFLLFWGLLVNAATAGKNLKFDVAENGNMFTPDETPVISGGPLAGFPAYGAEFITQGYIYPAGTLKPVVNGSGEVVSGGGVNPDGTPEFPDLVIGTWICHGWHVGDGAATVEGPWVITTQTWDIGDHAGETTIVTHGFEQPNSAPIYRAITGGTGRYLNAKGQQKQTAHPLLFNQSLGVMFSAEFTVH